MDFCRFQASALEIDQLLEEFYDYTTSNSRKREIEVTLQGFQVRRHAHTKDKKMIFILFIAEISGSVAILFERHRK